MKSCPIDPVYVRKVEETAAFLQAHLPGQSRVAVIAGSGLGGLVRSVQSKLSVPYTDIPHVGAATVKGHSGMLVYAGCSSSAGHSSPGAQASSLASFYLLNGRRHRYEGIPACECGILVRALLLAKPVENLIITNAAGGLNAKFELGDLMLIADHINWNFANPLIGYNQDSWGVRFPDLSDVYSKTLRAIARQTAHQLGINVREGVYAGMHGPSYETLAEVRFLRSMLGADAVGMSTVSEALIAAHMGRKVLGISFISNLLTQAQPTTHEEVVRNAALVEDKFQRLIIALVQQLGEKAEG